MRADHKFPIHRSAFCGNTDVAKGPSLFIVVYRCAVYLHSADTLFNEWNRRVPGDPLTLFIGSVFRQYSHLFLLWPYPGIMADAISKTDVGQSGDILERPGPCPGQRN